MFVDFGTANLPEWTSPVCLHKIFRLKADESYRVNHEPLEIGWQVLIIVTAGSGFLQFGKTSRTIMAGEAFLFSPGDDPFRYHTLGDKWDFWWFEFSGSMELLKDSYVFEGSAVSELCETCLKAVKQQNAKAASGLFSAILWQIFAVEIKENGNKKETLIFRKAAEIILKQLKSINVTSLSKELCLSERSLRDIFIENAGCSPKQYILSKKLDSAKFLLKNTNKSIGEISDSLGFSSQFHFCRFFNREIGIAPSAWRKGE